MPCSQCGQQVPPGQVRCPHCSTPLAAGFDDNWREMHLDSYRATSAATASLLGDHLVVSVPGFERDLGIGLESLDWFRRVLEAGGWYLAGTSNPQSREQGWRITRFTYRKR